MEKQRSFSSVKPVRFLVLSFTISFTVAFLIFFSIWVFIATPSSHLGNHSLRVNGSSPTLDTNFTGFDISSSKDTILKGAHSGRGDGVSSGIDSGSSLGQKMETGISVVTDVENKDRFFTINSSLTSSGKILPLVAPNSSSFIPFANSTVVSHHGLGHVAPTGDSSSSSISRDETSGREEDNIVLFDSSNISFVGENENVVSSNIVEEKNKKTCDITKGKWVLDERYPLYTNVTCPFIDEGFNCEANGRLDKDYMKWRWQPQDCDIPRFNATKMLELIRGKRLVFVGDSLNRNQWESMLCLLMGGVKDPKTVYETRGRKITKERGNYCFKFEEYKCTVEYYVSHYLVHESKAKIGKKRTQTLRIDTIDKGSSRWKGADILVFNTAHWWSHSKTKAGINYYQEQEFIHPQLDVTKAFEKALSMWASWVDKYINRHRTRVFFRSSAPSHFSGGLWNTGGHCKEAVRPINESVVYNNYPEKNLIVDEIIRQMKNPVTVLNITQVSDYRPDAHPSIYGRKSENIKKGVQDCSHWCLPGVPDYWNELLYYYLL